METKNWKSNIGDIFARHGNYRLKLLNSNLKVVCKEFIEYLAEFDGITASLKDGERIETHSTLYETRISISSNDHFPNASFILNCYYDNRSFLMIQYPVYYDYGAEMKTLFEENSHKSKQDDFYEFEQEELTEPERFEKDFIIQLIINRFERYIDTMKLRKT